MAWPGGWTLRIWLMAWPCGAFQRIVAYPWRIHGTWYIYQDLHARQWTCPHHFPGGMLVFGGIVDFCWVNVGKYTVPWKQCVMIVLWLIFKSYLTTRRWGHHSFYGNLLYNYTHAPNFESCIWSPGLKAKLMKLIYSKSLGNEHTTCHSN